MQKKYLMIMLWTAAFSFFLGFLTRHVVASKIPASLLSSSKATETGLGSYELNGKEVNVSEKDLSADESTQLYEPRSRLYDMVKNIVKQKYMKALIEKEQKDKKLSSFQEAQQSIMSQASEVSEEEVKFFISTHEHEEEMKQIPPSERPTQIRNYLQGQRRDLYMTSLIEKAEKENKIKVAIEKPVEQVYKVEETDSPVISSTKDKDAKVTVFEFADYQCPFCKRMSEPKAQLLAKYPQVRWVFKDYPLGFHEQAKPAAIFARCADEQGKYKEAHDALFLGQERLSESLYTEIATNLKLDMKKISSCRENPLTAKKVDDDQAQGNRLGVTGTPAFFINGRRVVGAVGVEVLDQMIQEEMSK